MTQNNLYMDEENMRLYVDVQPLFIDELESCKNLAVSSAQSAQQSEKNAKNWLDSIISYKTNIELFYAQSVNNLTNQLNNISNSISNAKNAALEGIETLKNSVMNTIQTTGQNIINQIIMYASDIQQTIDNNVSAEYLVQSNALESGCVSRINNVLDNIKSYSHSTFDSSKFTVTGSPIITSDGIASGFSTGNYIQTNTITFSNNVEIFAHINWSSLSNARLFAVNDSYAFLMTLDSNKYMAVTIGDGTNWVISSQTGTHKFSTNTDYLFRITFDGTAYKVYYSTDNGQNYTLDNTLTTTQVIPTGVINLGANRALSAFASCSINLKQFSITVDGVPVFSGNKTGIDTIKPDDYTVEGTPTISADGIASGFSGSDYLTTLTFNPSTKAWTIINSFTTGASVTGSNQHFLGNSANSVSAKIDTNGHPVVYLSSNGTSNDIGTITGTYTFLANTKYYVKIDFTGSKYILSYSLDGKTYTETGTAITSSTAVYASATLRLGRGTASAYPFGGSIDLNAFKVYVNGDLIYQPCLKIPYTESKTGSKVVDIAYRSRVQDMYEQFGYAPYYTLSDVDFTLPMGDLYGMIENLRKLIIQRTS